jgi:hypothetical protein
MSISKGLSLQILRLIKSLQTPRCWWHVTYLWKIISNNSKINPDKYKRRTKFRTWIWMGWYRLFVVRHWNVHTRKAARKTRMVTRCSAASFVTPWRMRLRSIVDILACVGGEKIAHHTICWCLFCIESQHAFVFAENTIFCCNHLQKTHNPSLAALITN